MSLPTIRSMCSPSGREVPNQFEIVTDDALFFQSYSTIIAKREFVTGKITLDERSWDCSVTTGKYRNMFLDENKRATQMKIDDGTYELANLNA